MHLGRAVNVKSAVHGSMFKHFLQHSTTGEKQEASAWLSGDWRYAITTVFCLSTSLMLIMRALIFVCRGMKSKTAQRARLWIPGMSMSMD